MPKVTRLEALSLGTVLLENQQVVAITETSGVDADDIEKPLHSDSLPGVRSVIESKDIRGSVFNNSSEVANRPAQTRFAIKRTFPDMATGNTGLKSAQIPRNTTIQM